MFSISNNGCVLGLCDMPRWVRMSDNGSYVQCKRKDADYLAFNSNLYKLDEVSVVEVDGGEITYTLKSLSEDNEKSLYDVAELSGENSDAVFDLAEYITSLEKRITVLEGGK